MSQAWCHIRGNMITKMRFTTAGKKHTKTLGMAMLVSYKFSTPFFNAPLKGHLQYQRWVLGMSSDSQTCRAVQKIN